MTFNNSCDGFYKDSLDVRFTKACDNNCAFCIEKNGLNAREMNVEKMIESTLQSGKQVILILGGEPFLYIDALLTYVKGIRNHVREIYITTSLPATIKEHMETFKEIFALIDGLNVSLQHYDSTINNRILNAGSNHNRIELLKELNEIDSHYVCRKIRVSINLCRGGIDNKIKLYNFLKVMEEINTYHVKINELQFCPESFISFEDIWGMKLPSPYAHGCQHEIKLPEFDMKITLKRACFCVEESRNATLSDLTKAILKKTIHKCKITQQVMYEDGTLSDGWITK